MTTTTNDNDSGDGATVDEVGHDGDGATGDDNDDDDNGGNDDDGNGATGDGSWICCRGVLKNSQTDHVLTIVAHTMTAKLISEEGCSTLCLRVGHKFYVRDFRTKRKICILAYRTLCFCVFVFLGMLHCFEIILGCDYSQQITDKQRNLRR
jgi:hypothetical protein